MFDLSLFGADTNIFTQLYEINKKHSYVQITFPLKLERESKDFLLLLGIGATDSGVADSFIFATLHKKVILPRQFGRSAPSLPPLQVFEGEKQMLSYNSCNS